MEVTPSCEPSSFQREADFLVSFFLPPNIKEIVDVKNERKKTENKQTFESQTPPDLPAEVGKKTRENEREKNKRPTPKTSNAKDGYSRRCRAASENKKQTERSPHSQRLAASCWLPMPKRLRRKEKNTGDKYRVDFIAQLETKTKIYLSEN